MQLKKTEQPAIASAEHLVSAQAAYLTDKYRSLFKAQDASSSRQLYGGYPPALKSPAEMEMMALEENMAKGGHGVPLSSECSAAHTGTGSKQG
jgi:hypothetical protein